MCHMVGTGVADEKSVRTRPAKGNIHAMHKLYFISNFRISTSRANIFETLHLQLKYIESTDT